MRKNWKDKPAEFTDCSQQSTAEWRSGSEQRISSARRWQLSMAVILLLLMACSHKEAEHDHETYTCPMHPTVIADKPGSCPVCGMDLVKKVKPGQEVEITEDVARLLKSPNEVIVASVKTITGEYKKIPVHIDALGMVTYDTRTIHTLPTRVAGRLEKVYVKYAFQSVTKGQKVAEIYSPELITAQREFLFLLENDASNDDLIHRAKERLSLLGMTQSQITQLVQRKEAQSTFTIFSPVDGYLVPETQQTPQAPLTSVQPQGSGMADGMGGGKSQSGIAGTTPSAIQSSSSGTVLIREGSYVSSGQTLFKMVNPASLRVELNIASALGGSIEKDDEIWLDFEDGHQHQTTIDFIQPFYNEGEEFYKVRVHTTHTDNLHIGHLVKAIVKKYSREAMWLPRNAVLDLGLDQIIFIKSKGTFKPKKVATGLKTADYIEIKEGLSSSDEVAAQAQYLVDSESFIKIKQP